MRWILAMALALLAVAAESRSALAQTLPQTIPTQCNAFVGLKSDAEQKALTVRAAMEKKAERKEICTLVQRFAVAEETVIKFLEKNREWCGIPEQAIAAAKGNHEHTVKFRTAACTEAPVVKPRAPSLSDAINTPSVDTAGNTKMGRGTLDTLTGNPLAK